MRRAEGAIAIHVLGTALLLLLLVAGLGLAEAVRASALKALAARSLAAAVQSAARTEPAMREQAFRQVLRANLVPATEHRASLTVGTDGALIGRLEMGYRMAYLGRWLPPFPVELEQRAFPPKRKAAP